MKQFDLKPVDSHKSFYGKATALQYIDGTTVLQSYNTIVCGIESGKLTRYWDGYSATTARHVQAFCIANDLPPVNKSEWLKIPVSKFNKLAADIHEYNTKYGKQGAKL